MKRNPRTFRTVEPTSYTVKFYFVDGGWDVGCVYTERRNDESQEQFKNRVVGEAHAILVKNGHDANKVSTARISMWKTQPQS